MQTHNAIVTLTDHDGRANAVTVADNADGTGIGGATPGTSSSPGGFLTGQWQRVSVHTLGITTLTPGTTGAVFKGANSQSQAQNDNGVFQGLTDDDGSSGFGELAAGGALNPRGERAFAFGVAGGVRARPCIEDLGGGLTPPSSVA